MTYERKSVIPTAAWVTAACLFAAALFLVTLIMSRTHGVEIRHSFMRVIVPGVIAGILSGLVLLIGYVHGDSKRRGMRYVMWTWLAILIPNGLGIIMYFVLRDPMPVYCSKCGGTMAPGYAFCPHCGGNIAAACNTCQRVSQAGWSHCAYCGTKL